jgi:hypothetical protein
LPFSCSRELEDLEPPSFPVNGDIFIDGFSGGLQYSAFGDSKTTAFAVDEDISYLGDASMRFDVPNQGDPLGGYAGGTFLDPGGRDMSGFDALTFWIRASQAATIDEIGFGVDPTLPGLGVILNAVPVTTGWQKVIIPIPDPAALSRLRVFLFYAEPPENGQGYSFWIDEAKFEKLGTLANPRPAILDSQNQVFGAETGDRFQIGGLSMIHNLPNGIDQRTNIDPGYFEFVSSNTSVATVSDLGVVTVLDAGEAVITATLNGKEAEGSFTVLSTGAPLLPPTTAPAPTRSQDSVISMYSNVYNNVVVDTWNPFWLYSTALVDDVQVDGDDMKRYKQLNFVGILTEAEKIDATDMTHFHMDIWTPDNTAGGTFTIEINDFGADGNFGGGDDSGGAATITPPALQSGEWVSIDVSLADMGLTNRNNIAQLVLSGTIPNVFVDNVYYYQADGGGSGNPTEPQMAAPTPTQSAGNVISLFSDAYSDVPVDTWRTDWSSADFADVTVAGNAVKRYTNLDFVGIETVMNTVDATGMTHFHFDVWSPNFTQLGIKLVDFGADGAFDGGDDVEFQLDYPGVAQGEWVSFDIPLSDFTELTTTGHIAQYIFVGQPSGASTVFLDNIYFYNDDGGSGGDEPTEAAPTPGQDAANVISIFSDAYTDEPVDTWRTDWSSADFEDVMVAGNAVKKYSNLDFVGIETVMNTVDVSGMTHFHIDVWSPDHTQFSVKLVDFGPDGVFGGDDTEHQIDFPGPATGTWVSYDIPLTDFVNMTTNENIAQYILVGQPTGTTTIYVDNMYFYSE